MVCKANVTLLRQSLATALLSGLAGLLTVVVAAASEGPDAPSDPAVVSAPLCAAPAHRAFDFWVGQWQVHLADGTLAGANRIEASADGCFLTERWQGARGSTGFSVNFYEPASDRWRQIWVSAGAIIEISGALEDGSMVLLGEIRYQQGPTRPFRGTWTPLPDGRVRQFFEELISDNTGGQGPEEKWQPWFEGFYAKAVE